MSYSFPVLLPGRGQRPARPLAWLPLLLLLLTLLPAAPAAAQVVAGRTAPTAAARRQVLREALHLTAADDLQSTETTPDALGFLHERYQLYHLGVKVEHGQYRVHSRGGRVETVSDGARLPAAGRSARPALTEVAARQRAVAAVGARRYKWQEPAEEAALKQQTGQPNATYQPTGELVWVGDFRQPEANRPVVLAWKYDIYAAEPVSRAYVYVDAQTGQVVFRDAIIKHVNAPGATFATRYVGARTSITDNTGSGFRLRETSTGKGVTTLNLRKSTNFGTAVDFLDNDNAWTAAEHDNVNKDNAALDAHLGAQATQAYWTTIHGRDSYDDRGTVLLSYVHYGNNIDNAFWNGTAMLYGDGNTVFKPLTSIDVCAHEVGHAVMQTTANLVYQGESGALNEGFSDIWGCAVENFFDPAKQKYLIGEDITLPATGAALRSMSNPNAFNQPDTYLGTNWAPTAVGQPDNGGVHTNSGVLNFWFYLISNGGAGTNDNGTAFSVTGISIAKAEKIAYRAQRFYITSTNNFASARRATLQAAIDLFGLGSAEVTATAQAWKAVGLNEPAPTLTGFTPASGLPGTVVTLTGTNLGLAFSVTFNGVPATIATISSSASIDVVVPPTATTGTITVTTPTGSATSAASFVLTNVGPAPTITSFSPSGGARETASVTLTGTNFTGATAVTFNGTAAAFTVTNATTISTTVPAGATSGVIQVTTPNGTASSAAPFPVLPHIASFAPTAGAVGASIVLTGTTLTGALDVKFNGVYATYTVNSATQITATVPAGATTGPITARTTSGLATSATNFTVDPTLAFSSFSPSSGAVSTTVVNIRGRGFAGTTAITFGGVNAPTFTVASDIELFVTVPPGAVTGNIVLNTPLGTATSPLAFTVTAPLVPTITSFAPTSGVVGDPVTITGTNFTGATAVTFNSTAAAFTLINSTTIFTSVPAGATSGVIRVTVPGGTATSANSFSVLVPGAPAISSFTPANGNAGTLVTLTGSNFAGTTAVAFNGTAAAFTLVSSTSITTTAPAGGTTGQISATNGFGTGLSATSFFYPPTNDLCANTGLPVLACGGSVTGSTVNSTSTGDPTATCITIITPGAGGVFYRFVGTGGSVTMSTCAAGTNYDTKLFVFTGTCGSYTCVTGNDDTSCGIISTASAVTFTSVAGTNYFVFVSGFNSNQGNFTLTATCVPVTPTITSFTPTSGVVGTSVDITGTNLTAASAVTFNGTAATTVTVNSATSITATVPAGATTGPIGVTVPGGSGVSGSNFTVLVAPALTSLTPNSGLVGASITLTGTGFTGATGVSFNGTAATTFSVTNATTATATVPVGTTSGNVTITTPNGTSNGVAFTVAPLTITALSPARNLRNALAGSDVAITFSQPMQNTAATQGAVKVFSQQRGGRMFGSTRGVASVSGSTITFNPTNDFKPGETVFVTTTTAATTSGGATLASGHVHQFTAAVSPSSPGTFTAPLTNPDPSVGNRPWIVALGDVDGDGDLDLFTANSNATTASVRLNDGAGSFSGTTDVSVGIGPASVALGDVDGDGDLDLLAANVGASTVSVRLNNGNGTFSGSQNVGVGSGANSMVVGDVEGDGDLDLLTANFFDNTVSVRHNDGNGTFSGTLNVSVGTNPYNLAVGDVDGDGDLDLLTANSGTNTVSVRRNDGAGTFSGTQDVSVDGFPFNVVVGDVDGDGDLDLLTASQVTNTASVRLNDGTGTFSGTQNVGVGGGPQGVAVGDVDGDGDLDLLTANVNATSVSVRLNDGAGTFSGTQGVSVGTAPVSVAVGDVDGDGDLDFVTANANANTVSVRLNQPLNAAPTAVGLSPQSVTENVAAGTAIGNFSTTDADAGDTHTYTLVSGAGDTDNGAFSISGGQLLITASPDYETQPSYAIRVRSTDQGSLFSEQTFTITVTNVNEAPILTIHGRSIPENSLLGAPVGAPIPASDPDAGTTLTYAITAGNTGGAFGFGANGQLQVVNSAALDFETTPTFSLTVQVSDGTLTDQATVTVSLTNVNETPTNLTLSNATIAENTGANVVVGSFSTTDPDAADTFTYALVSGAGSADNALVNLNGDELRVTASPDFETKASYAVRIRTTDAGGLFFDQAFVITITDVLETPANDAPTNIFLSNADVAENAANATVGLLTTADGDVADTHAYTLVSGLGSTGNAAFQLVGNELRTATALDFEAQASYSVRIRTTDSGEGNLFFEKAFTISVLDVAEPLTVSTVANVPGGLYSTLTVTGTGSATLTGAVTVTTALTVQAGGRLNTNCQPITGAGTFTLAAGATLGICDAAGISLSGPTGAVQVTGARSFASDASYVYDGTAAQATGNALPAPVRELEAANANGLTLSQAAAVTTTLRLTSGTLATAGNALTLLSTATRQAYAVHSGGLTSGTVTVQRYVGGSTAVSYHHLSSPVAAAPVSDLATTGFVPKVNAAYNNLPYVAPPTASFPNVFGFDETRGGLTPAFQSFFTGYFSPAALGTVLVPGRGYSVAIGGNKTPDFVGALTTGNVNIPLTVTGVSNANGSTKGGWHLLGNAYAQPIDWDLLTTPANLDASVFVWYSTGGSNGAYRARNASGVGNLTDGLIGVGQAFFVRATAATTFPFTNALRVEGNVALGRAANPAHPLLTLTLAKAGAPTAETDEVTVYAEVGATIGLDGAYDALRPGRNVGVPTLSALIGGHEGMISAFSPQELAAGQIVELTATVPAAGTYTLAVGRLANLIAESVVLRDRLTGTAYDLHQRPILTFTVATAGTLAGRFALVLNGQRVLGNNSNLATRTSPLAVYPNPAANGRPVQVAGCQAGAAVVVYDAAGRRVTTVVADASGVAELRVRGLAAGVYAVRSGGQVQRLVIE